MPWTRRSGRPTERQARTDACSYTSIHAGGQANTHTKELKEKRGYLDMGWGTQPQHSIEEYTLSALYFHCQQWVN